MDTFNLQLLLKENNDILLDIIKKEFRYSLNDIKNEIQNIFTYNKEDNKKKAKICGFGRTRNRGPCKRITRFMLCPYHLDKVNIKYENISLPYKKTSGGRLGNTSVVCDMQVDNKDIHIKTNAKPIDESTGNISLPDKIPSGKLPGVSDVQVNNKEINVNDSHYIEYIKYLNNIYYDYDELVYKNYILNEEIKILENIDQDLFIYEILIKNNSTKKNKKKKNKNKTIDHLYTIFNDKIKNLLSTTKFVKSETKDIKKIINDNLNKYIKIYKNNTDLYIYKSSINIFDEIEKYIEKKIDHDIDYFNKMLKNIFIKYRIFTLLVNQTTTLAEKEKWKTKIEDFTLNTLSAF